MPPLPLRTIFFPSSKRNFLFFALTPKGPQTFQWTGSPTGQGRLVAESALAIKREGTDTVYEWSVPWATLGCPQPHAGMALGFNFVALDSDAKGQSAHYWMGLTEGICGGKNPAAFRTFVLTAPQ